MATNIGRNPNEIPLNGYLGKLAFQDRFDDKSVGWKDNIQPFTNANAGGTTPASWQNMGNGIYAMEFDVGDSLFVQFHVNHDYALGTLAYPHIHWACTGALASGNTVAWTINYVIAKGHAQGATLTGTPTTFTITYTADGTEVAGEHIVSECSDANAFDLIEPDTIILMEIELTTKTVASGDIYGFMCDLHYQSDRDDTPQKSPNFYEPG